MKYISITSLDILNKIILKQKWIK